MEKLQNPKEVEMKFLLYLFVIVYYIYVYNRIREYIEDEMRYCP